jgi:RluA family pseudouridine synthase
LSTAIKLSSPATGEFWEIPILFEDSHLLALDKPAGLPATPDAGSTDADPPSLLKLLHAAVAARKPWTLEGERRFLLNVNDLDAETTGVLLFAKSKPVLEELSNLLGTEKVIRNYLALVEGAPVEDRVEFRFKLAPNPVRAGTMRVNPRGKRSHTICEAMEKFRGFTLVRCRAVTDRPHQLRVHLRFGGVPVVGDRIYRGKPLLLSSLKSEYHLKPDQIEKPLLARAAVHAWEFSFPHPVSREAVAITAPWPKDLQVAVKYLRRYAGL